MLKVAVVSVLLALVLGDGSSVSSGGVGGSGHLYGYGGPVIVSGQSVYVNGVPQSEPSAVRFTGPGNLRGVRVGLPFGGSVVTSHSASYGEYNDPLLADALRISSYGLGGISDIGKLAGLTLTSHGGDDDDSSKVVQVVQPKVAPIPAPAPAKKVVVKPKPKVYPEIRPEPERYYKPKYYSPVPEKAYKKYPVRPEPEYHSMVGNGYHYNSYHSARPEHKPYAYPGKYHGAKPEYNSYHKPGKYHYAGPKYKPRHSPKYHVAKPEYKPRHYSPKYHVAKPEYKPTYSSKYHIPKPEYKPFEHYSKYQFPKPEYKPYKHSSKYHVAKPEHSSYYGDYQSSHYDVYQPRAFLSSSYPFTGRHFGGFNTHKWNRPHKYGYVSRKPFIYNGLQGY